MNLSPVLTLAPFAQSIAFISPFPSGLTVISLIAFFEHLTTIPSFFISMISPAVPEVASVNSVFKIFIILLSLIEKYKSIEEVHAHADEVKPPRAAKNIVEYWEQAVMSKELATIITNAPVEEEPVSFTFEKARLIVREMADLLVLDLVDKGLVTDQIVLTVGYDIENLKGNHNYKGEITTDAYGRKVPKHAHAAVNLKNYTSSTKIISDAFISLYEKIVNKDLLIRRVNISVNNIIDEKEKLLRQKSLEVTEELNDKEKIVLSIVLCLSSELGYVFHNNKCKFNKLIQRKDLFNEIRKKLNVGYV